VDFIIPNRIYLERRILRRRARMLQLWALGGFGGMVALYVRASI
jgi:hypothetical protein